MKQDQLFSEHFDFALIVKKSLKLFHFGALKWMNFRKELSILDHSGL